MERAKAEEEAAEAEWAAQVAAQAAWEAAEAERRAEAAAARAAAGLPPEEELPQVEAAHVVECTLMPYVAQLDAISGPIN